LGADYAGGTGNDDSSINVFCIETKEQVYEYAYNGINPIDFANKIVEVGYEFNKAYLVPENNNHGLSGNVLIRRKYPLQLIYKHVINKQLTNASRNIPTFGYGWKTTEITKPYLVGILQQLLRAGWIIYGTRTEDQLRSFTEDPDTGKLQGQGAHDDCAISAMLASIGVVKLLRVKGIFLLDNEVEIEVPAVEDLEQKLIAPTKPAKEILCTWRDEQGQYVVPFTDMFGKRRDGRRSAHA
jgi:hypothetical protein